MKPDFDIACPLPELRSYVLEHRNRSDEAFYRLADRLSEHSDRMQFRTPAPRSLSETILT